MPSDIEPDLYPEDVEVVTPEMKHQRMRAAVGVALVVWGTALLINRSVGVDLETFSLGIGLGALAAWAQVRRYGWFVAGAVMTGAGLSDLLRSVFHGHFAGGVGAFLTAAGFLAIYVRYPRRSTWALVPAAIMGVIGAGVWGVGLIGLIPAIFGHLLLPALLIAAGGTLLMRRSLPRKVVRNALIGSAALFVLIGASSVDDVGDAFHFSHFRRTVPVEVPALEGRTLVIVGGTGQVEVIEGEELRVNATISGLGDRNQLPTVRASTSDKNVTVGLFQDSSTRQRFNFRSVAYSVTVPEGTDLQIRTTTGNIDAEVAGGDVLLESTTGNIDLQILDGTASDATFGLQSTTGNIEVDTDKRIDLDLASSTGRVEVNGEKVSEPFSRTIDGLDLQVVTTTGNIDIQDGA